MPLSRRRWIRRHSPVVRICHWVNLLCLIVLLMSGLQIFNAHPALYWGQATEFDHPWLALGAADSGGGRMDGITRVFGHRFVTTGLLGVSDVAGQPQPRGFPPWATLPGVQWLALGRRWHFFFAWLLVINGLVYLAWGLVSGHFRRDLLPTHDQLRHFGRTLLDHLRFRFPKGEEAEHYNLLQKLAYLVVVFVLLPLIVLAGLTMSPRLDSAFPGLLAFFGGRQSARSIHFLLAAALLAFVAIHLLMVVASGLWNNIRSMITGRYAIEESGGPDER